MSRKKRSTTAVASRTPIDHPQDDARTLLHCPIRGPLNISALARDGLTITEEARRIDCITFLLNRGYPAENIAVETVIVTHLGESARNLLRVDIIVYSSAAKKLASQPLSARIKQATIVAEIKRDSKNRRAAVKYQLEPALRLLPGMHVLGIYWDDINRLLFVKQIIKKSGNRHVEVFEDNLASLPRWGVLYKSRPLKYKDLAHNANLVGMLFNIANIMRSDGVNDEHVRYKETVKLILARYCDEREAQDDGKRPLSLQVYSGSDLTFMERIEDCYATAAKRYSRAKTLFKRGDFTQLHERTLRQMVKLIQGTNFLAASNEMMQQVFMSFVPAVFKKSLDQYFTPVGLVNTMVLMARIGPNDKIADPAMGTADFLTAASEYRAQFGDADILQRIHGMDSDPKAYDLAVVNMILNKDGQSNLLLEDSIARYDRHAEEINVALCNPPFGEKSIEKRESVLQAYDLGHRWVRNKVGHWERTDETLPSQQLGLLFIERCYKLLADGGRMAIILPEGYLCTPIYGYVRAWIVSHFRVLSLTELPRRMFMKSNADLRSNILVAKKLSPKSLEESIKGDYPIHAEMVRNVGFKMGKGYSPLYVRDQVTGLEVRDENNQRIIDTDFRRVRCGFDDFTKKTKWDGVGARVIEWEGARISDVLRHGNLDLKPRRLMPKALHNVKAIKDRQYVVLHEIAEIVIDTIDVMDDENSSRLWRLVEGLDIAAVEGTVTPQHETRAWKISDRKSRYVYHLQEWDIIVGLVRPERRNIGLLLHKNSNLIGSTDGIAVVRVKDKLKSKYPQEWLFSTLRSEACRLQLWTESGGTSYGKLTDDHIKNVLVPVAGNAKMKAAAKTVRAWAKAVKASAEIRDTIGSSKDRVPIVNSPSYGLVDGTKE